MDLAFLRNIVGEKDSDFFIKTSARERLAITLGNKKDVRYLGEENLFFEKETKNSLDYFFDEKEKNLGIAG